MPNSENCLALILSVATALHCDRSKLLVSPVPGSVPPDGTARTDPILARTRVGRGQFNVVSFLSQLFKPASQFVEDGFHMSVRSQVVNFTRIAFQIEKFERLGFLPEVNQLIPMCPNAAVLSDAMKCRIFVILVEERCSPILGVASLE